MPTVKYSVSAYVADGTTTDYLITWDYLDDDHISVEVDGVSNDDPAANHTFTKLNDTTVRVTDGVGGAIVAGKEINIRRRTPITTRPISFADGSALLAADLNKNSDYLLFSMQEALDEVDFSVQFQREAEGFRDDTQTLRDATAADLASFRTGLATFDERYLGTFATDPALDNDGNALIDGALYFDTTNNVLKVYDLGNTSWARTTPTTTDQANINTLTPLSTQMSSLSTRVDELGRLGTTDAVADLAILGTVDAVADMNTLAAISTDIEAVADKAAFITADFVSDLNTLATTDVVADLNQLATSDIVADLNMLAQSDVIADINTLAETDIIADLNTLATADVVSDLNQLATSDFVADLNTLATTANVANLATVATDIANINAIAPHITGVNSFADRYRVSTNDPTSDNDEGDLAYVSADNAVKYFDGTNWQSISLGLTDIVGDATPQLGGVLDTNGNNVEFGDSTGSEVNRLKFGVGDDLEIYHNGTHNYIEAGSSSVSDLILVATDDIIIGHGTASSYETMASFNNDGSTNLYYNNALKLSTSSLGVTVTGDVNATDDLFVNGGYARIQTSSTSGAILELKSTDSSATGDQHLGTVNFYGSDGSSPGAGVKSSVAAHATGFYNGNSYLSFSNSGALRDTESVRMYTNITRFYNGHLLQLYDDNNSNFAGIEVPSVITSNYTMTLPAAGPSAADQILVSDASGNLSFEAKPTGANVATMMAFA